MPFGHISSRLEGGGVAFGKVLSADFTKNCTV